MSNNGHSYVLLSFSDSQNDSGKTSANLIFDRLMNQHVWFTSRKSKALITGTTVLFYQAAAGIRGYAKVTQIFENSKSDFELLQNLGLYQLRFKLTLSNIVKFESPVPLGPMVERLEFVANKKYWGHSVRGTPRSISFGDFEEIVNAANIKRD